MLPIEGVCPGNQNANDPVEDKEAFSEIYFPARNIAVLLDAVIVVTLPSGTSPSTPPPVLLFWIGIWLFLFCHDGKSVKLFFQKSTHYSSYNSKAYSTDLLLQALWMYRQSLEVVQTLLCFEESEYVK